MRYRVEHSNEYLPVRQVETDREVGYALDQLMPVDGRVVEVCNIYNHAGEWLAVTSSDFHKAPLQIAAIAVARHEEANDFIDLKDRDWNAPTDRIERRLGNLLADTIGAFAYGLCEAVGPGSSTQTQDQFAALLAELASLWRVSRVGCYDADTRSEEPYFANPSPSGPRLTFSGAAQAYGMRELRERYPNLSDAERQRMLGWVLQWLQDTLLLARANNIQQSKSKRRAAACP
jgi:hypothetical protein